MDDLEFSTLVQAVTGDRVPRVWSLLVTIFGELAQDPEARISGTLLARMSEMIGIKPEAMRVALHRLRKDDWIESYKRGRKSAYGLAEHGRRLSARATPSIYSPNAPADRAWLVLADPDQAAQNPAMAEIWITPTVALATAPPNLPKVFASEILPANPLPNWVTAKVCSEELCDQTRNLLGRLAVLQGKLQRCDTPDPLQVSVLRVLIVHSWRRIVLKQAALPDHLFPPQWQGRHCRQLVLQLLSNLPGSPLATIEAGLG